MYKIKNIEFLRLIGCLSILMFHLCNKILNNLFSDIDIYSRLGIISSNGNKAVDLFFIISGLFFAYKLNTKYNLYDFIKRKIIRLWPVLLFIMGLSFVVSLTGIIPWNLNDNIFALLGFNGTSFILKKGQTSVGVFWYVSSMMWTLGIFYYMLKYFKIEYVNFIIAVSVIVSYSILIHVNSGQILGIEKTYYYIFHTGMMRAIGAIGIGYFIGSWYRNNEEQVKSRSLKLVNKLGITIIEGACIIFIISNLMLRQSSYKNQFIFILVFSTCIFLFLIRKGYISYFLNNSKVGDFSVYLSKYTYSIYMVHFFIFQVLKNSLWKTMPEFVYIHPIINIDIAILLVLILGIFTYHCVELPCAKYLKNLWLNASKTLTEQEKRGGGNP